MKGAAAVGLALPAASLHLQEYGPAAAAQDEQLGSSLIGELEGPVVLVDAPRPETLQQAPMLDALVEDGTLPPVEERVPLEPLVVQPLEGIGTYGGTLRRGFTGPGDDENGNRWVSGDKLIFWDYTGTEFRPALAKSWEFSDGDRVFTIKLREGHKWSDGAPFTADDFVFWYEDIYTNPDLVPVPHASFAINGKQGRIEKVDDTTVSFIFDEPYPLFLTILGGTTFMGSGHMTNRGFHGGSYAPAHYLKQFHPKYAAQADIDQLATEANVEDWIALFRLKNQWSLNPDLPILGPWRSVQPVNTPNWVLERNPFYYEVDPEGNQLPYIDQIQMGLAENLEVLNLRAIAGEYDLQERHTDIAKLPVFLENMEQGDYSVHLDPGAYGSDATLQINHSYDADPEVAQWLHNPDFRRALSMGIDRDQLNETFWLGVGSPGSVAPDPSVPQSPGEEWRTKWSTLDVEQANQLLDEIGLTEKDGEGFRMRSDGSGRLRLEVFAISGAFVPFPRIAQSIAQQWQEIGIQLDVSELERNLGMTRMRNNEHQIFMWANDGSELIYAFPRHALPVDPAEAMMGPLIANWYVTNGEEGMAPTEESMIQAIEMYTQASGQSTEEANQTAQEIWKIIVDNVFSIGTVGVSPAVMGIRIVKNTMGNIPARQVNMQHARTPQSSHPATF
ncbi:MAG: ABC transporter substrate-binding protein, partial [Chloroflexi bacterium]|nr:ABC transporter substrate-binding protein [Chloroflexota bacterium]